MQPPERRRGEREVNRAGVGFPELRGELEPRD
jgi:hypothetical protein